MIHQNDKNYKQSLVKKKQEEDEYDLERRRIISEMRDKLWKEEEEAKEKEKRNQLAQKAKMHSEKEQQIK